MTQTIYLKSSFWERLNKERELTGKTNSQIIKEALENYFQKQEEL